MQRGRARGLARTDRGDRGGGLPLEARILSDAFDAMVSERPYRAALVRVQALAEVGRCSGTQFDPEVASVFLSLDDLRAAS